MRISDTPEGAWDENSKRLTELAERMMKAGWVSEFGHDNKGFAVVYTETGRLRMDQLQTALKDLGFVHFTPDEFAPLAVLLAARQR